MSLLLWEYGSMPASLFFLLFELPNSEILTCITYSSTVALQKPHGHLTPHKSSGQNKRGGQKSMLSSETILSLPTQVTREQIRGLFIYIVLQHVQTKTLEKRDWLTSSSLARWEVLSSGGPSQGARVSELSIKRKWTKQSLCGQNQTSHTWQEPPSRGACHSPHPSPDTPTLWRTGLLTTGLKSGLGLSKRTTTRPCCTVLHSTGLCQNIHEGYWAVVCSRISPTPPCLCSPKQAPFNLGTFWYNFIKIE